MSEIVKTGLPASAAPGGPLALAATPTPGKAVSPPLPSPGALQAKPPPVPAPTPLTQLLKAPSVILMGPTGTGKTDILIDLISQGLELFVIVTEPNGLESLLDSVSRRKADINKLHYHIVEPARAGFDDLKNVFDKISSNTHEGLTKASPGLRTGAKILEVVATLRNFHCQRTGVGYGSVAQFGPDRAVAIDSLSGINDMAMDVTTGDKVTAHQGEWGIAMKGVKMLVNSCTSNLKCIFVLTAHVGREPDETMLGVTKIMVDTLGKKLAPSLPRYFSEVVLTKREGGKYYWSTDEVGTDLKRRALPLSAKIEPGFKPILDKYKQRNLTVGVPQP